MDYYKLTFCGGFGRESMPPDWEDFSQAHLRHANHEREGSMRLRGLIASTLSQTSQDMREQADRVEEALNQRTAETEEATRGLEDNLKQVKLILKQFKCSNFSPNALTSLNYK